MCLPPFKAEREGTGRGNKSRLRSCARRTGASLPGVNDSSLDTERGRLLMETAPFSHGLGPAGRRGAEILPMADSLEEEAPSSAGRPAHGTQRGQDALFLQMPAGRGRCPAPFPGSGLWEPPPLRFLHWSAGKSLPPGKGLPQQADGLSARCPSPGRAGWQKPLFTRSAPSICRKPKDSLPRHASGDAESARGRSEAALSDRKGATRAACPARCGLKEGAFTSGSRQDGARMPVPMKGTAFPVPRILARGRSSLSGTPGRERTVVLACREKTLPGRFRQRYFPQSSSPRHLLPGLSPGPGPDRGAGC